MLEFQETIFKQSSLKLKMMKNKLGYLYDNYFMDVYHHDEITNRHQIQLEALIQIMIMVVLLFSIFIYKKTADDSWNSDACLFITFLYD